MTQFLQLVITGITMGAIYSLIGLGYVTIYSTSHVVNMAQGSFVMVGAFFGYSLLGRGWSALLGERSSSRSWRWWSCRWGCTCWCSSPS